MNRLHYIALEDGSVFYGRPGGAGVDRLGEVVFNTGMTGYQEIAGDPSYAGQIVILTTAEVGNYGCNPQDMESRGLFLSGMLMQNLNEPSNYRSTESLGALFTRFNVPCLDQIDVRGLVLKLRDSGTMKGYLHASDEPLAPEVAVRRVREWEGLEYQDYAAGVSVDTSFSWNEQGDLHVVVYDFGVKYNILRRLASQNLRLTVVPAKTPAAEVLKLKPDGVCFSNGPADPRALDYAIQNAGILSHALPVMGICLGHQLLGIALGARCGRLKFGHHGCNHPVKNLITGQVEITSQNHNYALSETGLPEELEITHWNLNDHTIEGFRHRTLPVMAVQFHPESAPGPHDSQNFFSKFRAMLEGK